MRINTRILMTASALFMGAVGIAACFMPQEILSAAGISTDAFAPPFLQMTGALYVGFAMVNWMSKGNIIGGIYARPIALGNFTHFIVGALALIKGQATAAGTLGWLFLIVYIMFAIAFSIVLFTHPLASKQPAEKP